MWSRNPGDRPLPSASGADRQVRFGRSRRRPSWTTLAVRDAAEWLSTLDVAAERLETKASYREAPIDPAAIEAVLRDADQPPAVRAAAARVLLRAGRERRPIEEVLATFHGEGTTKAARIAAGLDVPTDAEAARALDALVLCGT